MLAEEGLERHRRRQLAGPDQRSRDLEDAAMNFLDEVLASEEIRDAVERVIVDQDRAEQRLFGLEVVRRRAIGALLRQRLALGELFDRRHGCGASLYEGWTLRHAERLTHDKTYPRTAATTSHPCSQTRRAARAKAATSDEKKEERGESRCYLDARLAPVRTRVSSAGALFRLGVFAREPRDEFGDRLHGSDGADALAASPDVAPRLGFLDFRRASGSEIHRLGLPLRESVRVEPGLDDRGPQIVAEYAGEVGRPDDVGGVAADDRLLILLDRARFGRGDKSRADIGEVGAHHLGCENSPPGGDRAGEQQGSLEPGADVLDERERRGRAGMAAGASGDRDQPVGALFDRLVGEAVVDDVV